MIEFDVALSKDGKLVLLHDNTLDRTTNGSGPVGSLPLAELKKLDAGSWKGSQFKNTPIPTLDEALAIMPENIWLNVHLKGGVDLAKKTTERIAAHQRLHQSFLACGASAAAAARLVNPQIQICNMERQANSLQYVKETIGYKSEFIQLYGGNQSTRPTLRSCKENAFESTFAVLTKQTRFTSCSKQALNSPWSTSWPAC